MKKPYVITLAVAALSLAIFWLWNFTSGPSPDRLAVKALSDKELREKVNAVVEMSMIKAPDPTPQLRRVLKETTDPEVQAQAITALAFRLDSESTSQFYAALDHASPKVRQAAYAGVLRFHGGGLPEELQYSADAPSEDRAQVVRRLQEIHDKTSKTVLTVPTSPVTVAAVAKEPPAKEPPAKEPPTKEPASKEPPSKDPPPTPSTAPLAAPVQAQPPGPFTPTEYPAITLLVWMLQVIAILVLIFGVVGAISLIMGEKNSGKQAPGIDNKDASMVGPPVEKNSAVLWTKIALLIAATVCIVALLTAAEMVRLAVRMEQKMDNMSRTR